MRISDWRSDVCSSDLIAAVEKTLRRKLLEQRQIGIVDEHLQVARQFEIDLRGEEGRRFHLVGLALRRQHREGRGKGGARDAIADRVDVRHRQQVADRRSDEHTSEIQSLMRISYAVFGLKKKNTQHLSQRMYPNHIIRETSGIR